MISNGSPDSSFSFVFLLVAVIVVVLCNVLHSEIKKVVYSKAFKTDRSYRKKQA